ncbi:PAS domain S-box protein [Coleofasciculus sp. F4-SAH-05]|uniref:PAS domain S-box protein n=1 Tax=Coleofasciculus sp. F4-SAH-05 TaxID=3069525 RepID=UPI0032FF2DFA
MVEQPTFLDLTELDHPNLQGSEQNATGLSDLVANIPGAIYRRAWDSQWTTRFITPAIQDICGYPASDFTKNRERSLISIIHPDDQPIIAQALAEQLTTQQPYWLEYRIVRSDGSVVWICDKGQGIFDETGQLLWLDGIILDISQRQPEVQVSHTAQPSETIQESDALYHLMVETASEGVWMFDVNSQTIFANSRMAEMLGYRVEEMIGRSLFDFMDAESRPLYSTYVLRRRHGIQERHPFKFRRKDGSELWAIVSATPILNAQGEFVGVLRMITDISDTHEESAQRQQAENALRESERRFRAIFDATFQFIGLLKPDGTVLEANQTALNFGGLRREDVAGRPFWQTRWWSYSSEIQEQLKDAIAAAAMGEFVRYEVEVIGANNQVITIDFSLKPVTDETGQVVLLIPEGRDISEQKQIREALRQSESRLKLKNKKLKQVLRQLKNTQAQLVQNEKMISLGQMMAGIAHEINNPISFIYGNITYARDYTLDLFNLIELYAKHYPAPVPEIQDKIEAIDLQFLSADFPKLLNSMQDGAERIREIILSLRNFSRLDEAEQKFVNIHEGINSTLLILQHRLKKTVFASEIQVIKEYSKLPMIQCYPSQINQVFMNLLNNAIDALDQKAKHYENLEYTRTITISTSVRTQDNHLRSSPVEYRNKAEGRGNRAEVNNHCLDEYDINSSQLIIRIADNGIGIPQPLQKHIFDPFFTTKPVGVGTGLGLSISLAIIVEKHGGKLSYSSEPGQGTEFIIELPIHPPRS